MFCNDKVGHTWQKNGKVLPRCRMPLHTDGPVEPRIFVIDLGISSVYRRGGGGALEFDVDNGKLARITAVYLDGNNATAESRKVLVQI